MNKDGSKNSNLNKAKKNKEDEFYTELSDIENELKHYKDYFKGKTVYCNCDDYRVSNFFKYFATNFHLLGLQKLISTSYFHKEYTSYLDGQETGIWVEYVGELGNGASIEDIRESIEVKRFKGNGDFRSEESVALLNTADVVVTNPPFSKFREYVAQLMEHGKKFLIIGSYNALTYKEIFPLIQANKIWVGNYSGAMNFRLHPSYLPRKTMYWEDDKGQKWIELRNVQWYTNIDHEKRKKNLPLTAIYEEGKYEKYDNYDAINIDKLVEIPKDYDGVMGVPITFISKYNPNQFKIVRFRKGDDNKDLSVKGKYKYCRVLVRRRES